MEHGIWRITHSGRHDVLVWSTPYKHLIKYAEKDYYKFTGHSKMGKISCQIMSCCVPECYSFAETILQRRNMPDGAPLEWAILAKVQYHPEHKTMAPSQQSAWAFCMCGKHARRFRRKIFERLLRVEERLDELQKEMEDG